MNSRYSVLAAALLAVATSAGGVLAAPPQGDGPWMLRVSPLEPARLAELTGADHMKLYREKGFALLFVDRPALERLLAAGFGVEVDAERTALLAGAIAPVGPEAIPSFPCYRTVEETFGTMATLAASYPALAAVTDAGDSWEKTQSAAAGYDMRVLKLTNSALPGPKPTLYVTSAIHAREYTTAELVTRFAEELVYGYGSDADATWLLDHHEIHLLLQANPDGRKKAETGLWWRKNTNNNYCTGSDYRGADLNRNFDFEWDCCGGSSSSACDETYHGAAPDSEPEVQAIQSYGSTLFPDQRGPALTDPAPADATGVYLDLHSYGEQIMTPWGFETNGGVVANAPEFLRLARKYAYFSGYEPMLGAIYIVDGSTMDYFYGELGVAAGAWELGTAFFESCESFESNVLPQGLAMLRYAAKVARTPYMTPAGPDVVSPSVPAEPLAPGEPAVLSATVDDTRYSTAVGIEPAQAIAAAQVYVETPPWAPGATPLALGAADGAFDETIEGVSGTLDTTGLAAGKHLLFFRGRDLDGNWGPVSAQFLWILDPATAPTIQGSVREAGSGAPLAATVTVGPFATATEPATGAYSILVPPGTYDVTATAADHAPATATGIVASASQTVTVNFDLPAYSTVLADDAEQGNLGWTAQAPWALTTEASASPTHSWTDSPGGLYANYADTSLTSPVLDLSQIQGTVLAFRQTYDLESGWDYGYVEISTNGGGSWSTAATYNGTQTASWQAVELALPQLDGVASARIRFRLTADSYIERDGWHLDDIAVRGFAALVPIFADGFESSDTSAWSVAIP